MASIKPKKYEYGRSPDPANWHETADIIRESQHKTKKKTKKPSSLDDLMKYLKDKQ